MMKLDSIRFKEEAELFELLEKAFCVPSLIDLIPQPQPASLSSLLNKEGDNELFPVHSAFPDVSGSADEVLNRLELNDCGIEFFISSRTGIRAEVVGIPFSGNGKGAVVLSVDLVEACSADELKAVMAHELAHFYYRHHHLHPCYKMIDIPGKTERLMVMDNLYRLWAQLSEISADRAMLLAVDDPESALSSLYKRHLKKIQSSVDMDTLFQEDDADFSKTDVHQYHLRSHPPRALRTRALKLFSDSDLFASLKSGKGQADDDTLPEMEGLTEKLKICPTTPGQFLEFGFLIAAGNYLIQSDGFAHHHEIHQQRANLARLIYNPEQSLIQQDNSEDFQSVMEHYGEKIHRGCSPDVAIKLFRQLTSLVFQDGKVAAEEIHALTNVAKALGISKVPARNMILETIRKDFFPAGH
ncbi:M48 family metalloprotease [Thermodesulfobacteriota bacterium]